MKGASWMSTAFVKSADAPERTAQEKWNTRGAGEGNEREP